MKKGSEWFKLLSEKEQQEFKENCSIFEYLISNTSTLWDFIESAFIWDETPQGGCYWQEIASRRL